MKFRSLAVLSAVGAIVGGGAASASVVTTPLSVTGAVGTPTTETTATLQALPQVTQTDSFKAGPTTTIDTFTGPTLWDVLQSAGGIQSGPAKNSVLSSYVTVTGSDGYKTVISAGEIDPKFGNKADLVAITDTAGTLPVPNGFARTTAPGDAFGGRYVSNVASLAVGVTPLPAATPGSTTSSFTVSGDVAHAVSFDLAQLEALTPHTETVTYLSGSTSVTDTYTGASLWDVLSIAGIATDPAIKNDILRKLIAATGSDGYQVDFSAGEIDPMFGDEPILVAYADTDGQFGPDGVGFARLVVPGDAAGGRYVSNLSGLDVIDPTAVPEPASAVVLLAGIVGLGMTRRARRTIGAQPRTIVEPPDPRVAVRGFTVPVVG